MSDDSRYEVLAMKAVDGLLSEEERQELDALLAGSPERRAELDDFVRIREGTDAMRQRIAATAGHQPPREDAATRAQLGLGFILVCTGLVITYGYGAILFFSDSDAPLWLRIGLGTLGAGALLLFAKVLSTRFKSFASDPYKEIDR